MRLHKLSQEDLLLQFLVDLTLHPVPSRPVRQAISCFDALNIQKIDPLICIEYELNYIEL